MTIVPSQIIHTVPFKMMANDGLVLLGTVPFNQLLPWRKFGVRSEIKYVRGSPSNVGNHYTAC